MAMKVDERQDFNLPSLLANSSDFNEFAHNESLHGLDLTMFLIAQ